VRLAVALLVFVSVGAAVVGVRYLYLAHRELPFCPQARPPSRPPSPPEPLSLDERDLARSVAVNDDTVQAIAKGQSVRSWGEVGSSYDPLTGAPEATVNVTWAEPTSAPARLFRSYGPKGAGSLDKTGRFDGVIGVITTVRLSDRKVIRILPWGGTAHGLSKSTCRARD
jgi:hypothetical protein